MAPMTRDEMLALAEANIAAGKAGAKEWADDVRDNPSHSWAKCFTTARVLRALADVDGIDVSDDGNGCLFVSAHDSRPIYVYGVQSGKWRLSGKGKWYRHKGTAADWARKYVLRLPAQTKPQGE